jgi:hypothetical protein
LFVTGFIDAEGCFILDLFASKNYKHGYQVSLNFKISVHSKDGDLLEKLKIYFGVGNIIKHGANSLQYRVTSYLFF